MILDIADSVNGVPIRPLLSHHELKILTTPIAIVRGPLYTEDALHDLKFRVETWFGQLEFVRRHARLIKIDLGQ